MREFIFRIVAQPQTPADNLDFRQIHLRRCTALLKCDFEPARKAVREFAREAAWKPPKWTEDYLFESGCARRGQLQKGVTQVWTAVQEFSQFCEIILPKGKHQFHAKVGISMKTQEQVEQVALNRACGFVRLPASSLFEK